MPFRDREDRVRADILAMAVKHAAFAYVAEGAGGRPVVIFKRSHWVEPSTEQIADYRRRREIVEKHGGEMRVQDFQCAGPMPLFTEQDCTEMLKAVTTACRRRGYTVAETWNGAGCLTFSVSLKKARGQTRRSRR